MFGKSQARSAFVLQVFLLWATPTPSEMTRGTLSWYNISTDSHSYDHNDVFLMGKITMI